MTDQLDQRLRDHYEAAEPSPEAIQRLLDAVEAPGTVATPAPTHRPWLVSLATAAALLVCLIPVALLLGGRSPAPDREAAIEIALNHRKGLAMEVRCGHYSHIQRKLPKLDFVPTKPEGLAGSLHLVGARYCHIGPSIAVQCRLEGADGARFTLYQFRPRGRQQSIQAGAFDLDDVRVRVWRQGRLVLGLAQTR